MSCAFILALARFKNISRNDPSLSLLLSILNCALFFNALYPVLQSQLIFWVIIISFHPQYFAKMAARKACLPVLTRSSRPWYDTMLKRSLLYNWHRPASSLAHTRPVGPGESRPSPNYADHIRVRDNTLHITKGKESHNLNKPKIPL